MERFRRWIEGRYGGDELGVALIVLYLLLTLIFMIADAPLLWLTAYVPLVLAALRMFSRRFDRRRRENEWFLKAWRPVRNFFVTLWHQVFGGLWQRLTDRDHRYYLCPACKARMRVPRGHGKVNIRCARCGKTFVRKS